MPEKQQRNPFEQHINSESFDVSQLGDRLPLSEMDIALTAFFDALPEDLSDAGLHSKLTEKQQIICIHLTAHLLHRIKAAGEYPAWIDDMPENELREFLLLSFSSALLADEALNPPEEPDPEPDMTPYAYQTAEYAELPVNWGGLRASSANKALLNESNKNSR
ncbi:MAG: hypothetical protein AAFQ07_02330, partial [Chloroflexota bacterium]